MKRKLLCKLTNLGDNVTPHDERDRWNQVLQAAQRTTRNVVKPPDTQAQIIKLSDEKERLLAEYRAGDVSEERRQQLSMIESQLADLWARRRQERAVSRRRN